MAVCSHKLKTKPWSVHSDLKKNLGPTNHKQPTRLPQFCNMKANGMWHLSTRNTSLFAFVHQFPLSEKISEYFTHETKLRKTKEKTKKIGGGGSPQLLKQKDKIKNWNWNQDFPKVKISRVKRNEDYGVIALSLLKAL